MLAAPSNTRPPKDSHRLDEAKLGTWLAANVPGATPQIQVQKFKGGQSNPTYWIGAGPGLELVLRKKPPGKLLPSAHAVEREYRVMRALAGTDVPVPEAMALCEDESIIGTTFFVMRYVPGRIFWDPSLPDMTTADERRALYRELVRVLAAIHTVDVEKVGLGDFGKKGGFIARQVERWSKQYEASKTAEVAPMEALMKWLAANVPAHDETTLIHGDYRLDNMLFDANTPKCLGVIDWELSTLGHPISDLAYTCMHYHLNVPGRGGLAGVDVGALGIPTEDELVADYCRAAGRDGVRDWSYFMAFGLFRLAAIAQGVYRRSLQGNASADDAGLYEGAVYVLSDLACRLGGLGD